METPAESGEGSSQDQDVGEEVDYKRIIEALLFSADEPLTIKQIRRICRGWSPGVIRQNLNQLREEYDKEERSFRLVEIENGFQILTEVDYFPYIRRLRNDIRTVRLSRAALETLSIVAYKQPVTRAEIEEIRGVDAGGVLKTLLERGLATIKGRAEGVGRPLLYGTSDFFLNHFGLRDLDELPRIEELAELMRSREMDEIHAEVNEKLGPPEESDDSSDPGGFEFADDENDETLVDEDSADRQESADNSPDDDAPATESDEEEPAAEQEREEEEEEIDDGWDTPEDGDPVIEEDRHESVADDAGVGEGERHFEDQTRHD